MSAPTALRLSIPTPVVTTLPGVSSPWEQTGTIEDVARIAEVGDRLGYHHLSCSEHVGVPADEAVRRGGRYYDPLATLGYIAARTSRIRLATMVLVLGYHHPLEIAKRYGTLDVVSNGRLILGLGVGTLKAEFDLLDVPFEDRGARADDALRALRASLSQPVPSYEGEFYSFGGLKIDPCAVQDKVPLWIGGRTRRSLRRAIALADAWCPFGLKLAQAKEWLEQEELPPGFEVLLPPARPLDPIRDPDRALEELAALAEVGTTVASTWFVHDSPEHFIDQLEALAAIYPPS
ncbi:TIGR03619 family F420-dependent LLM class oxidoreductase [Frankia sp. R82]|uniref:TIGR03619 family F420-dependent LLM class oxidoreductase n=1 Tax=Frankia sp. R82 TaxID=2950553 RepID=UPI0020445CBB|nr:TIGR03619 family F420-dependent LLM class oxidoreductase [Frankia sp. R82]MCM3882163.1 TIGR03619 family F420-dependent LLM class oxidoreductase [Frankia sp. R82]